MTAMGLFRCFPVEPFSEEENTNEMERLSITKEKLPGSHSDKQTQTERLGFPARIRKVSALETTWIKSRKRKQKEKRLHTRELLFTEVVTTQHIMTCQVILPIYGYLCCRTIVKFLTPHSISSPDGSSIFQSKL